MRAYRETDDLQAYLVRVRPALKELFSMACAICGDERQAETALQRTLLAGFQNQTRFRTNRVFRERLFADLRRIALKCAGGETEYWEQMEKKAEQTDDPLLLAWENQRPTVRRALTLRFGCQLTSSQTARCLKMSSSQARRLLRDGMTKLEGALPMKERRQLPARLRHLTRELLTSEETRLPDLSALFRGLEAEYAAPDRPKRHIASKLISALASLLAAVILAVILWGISALIRPAQLEKTPAAAEEVP